MIFRLPVSISQRVLPTLALLGLVAGLTACGGSSDSSNTVAESTPPTPVALEGLNLAVEQWQLAEDLTLQVQFRATNGEGEGVAGLQSTTVLGAQLLPEGFTGAGNSSEWQFLLSEFCDLAGNCPGSLTDQGDGIYQYQTSASLDEGSGYNPDATQRIVVKIGGDTLVDGTEVPVVNANVDFTPPQETPIYTRDLVATAVCESCHSNLGDVFHNGLYTELETCSVCHNPSGVSNPANSLSGLAHRVHNPVNLAPLMTCDSCHAPDNGLANTNNWSTKPTELACGSCHTNINFETGEGHLAQVDNANCAACHQSGDTRAIHLDLAGTDARQQFAVDIVATEPNMDNGTLDVVVALSNPLSGEPYDSPDSLVFLESLRLMVNWGTAVDYQEFLANFLNLQFESPREASDAGQYRYRFFGLDLAAMIGGGTLAVDGALCHVDGMLAECSDSADVARLLAKTLSFNLDGLSEVDARRHIVSNDTCGSCHGDQQLDLGPILPALHANANDLSQQCQLCHNGLQQAKADAENQSASSANYSHLVHGIHAGVRPGYEDLVYPGNIANCRSCHIQDEDGDSFALPLEPGVPPLAVDDGTYTSPISASCRTCHNSQDATNHITGAGGVISGTLEAASAAETCAACHGPGAFVDVAIVHGLH